MKHCNLSCDRQPYQLPVLKVFTIIPSSVVNASGGKPESITEEDVELDFNF